MLHLARLSLALSIACNTGADGDGDPTDLPATTDTAEPTTTTPDTGWPEGDFGSLMIVEDPQRGLGLYGLFVNQQPGFDNLAYCAIEERVCVNGFPADLDTTAPYNPTQVFDPVFSQYRYVGDTVQLGPYSAELYSNSETGLAFYYAQLGDVELSLGPMGVTFGGQWGDYSGGNDIAIGEPIEVIYPRAGATARTTNAAYLPIEWIPTPGEGAVHLFAQVGDPPYLGLQWWLEDDGYFALPIDEILLGGLDPTYIGFTLERWNTGVVSHHGHTLEITHITGLEFGADYDYVGSRTYLEPSDNCAQAVNNIVIDDIGTHSYWGRMTGYDLDVPDQCGLGGGSGAGLVAVSLPPLTAMAASYNLPKGDALVIPTSRDAALWLTDDCSVSNACLAGSNVNDDFVEELVSYFNPSTTEDLVVYIVLGGDDSTGDIFWLDVEVSQLFDPNLSDECLEATQSAGLAEGGYYSEEVSFLDGLNPGIACTNSQTPGPDAMNKVTLQAGQTLTASVQMPGSDPALYLLYNCTQPQTCAVGADANFGMAEQLVYSNTSGFQENLYIVVDTKGTPMQPYFLTLDLYP